MTQTTVYIQATTGTVHTVATCGVRRRSHSYNQPTQDMAAITDGLQRGVLKRCQRCAADLAR